MKTPFQVFTGMLLLAALALTACGGVSDADAVQTIVAGTMSAQSEIQPVEAAATAEPTGESGPTMLPTETQAPAAAQPAGPEANVTFEDISLYLDYSLTSSWTYEVTSPPDPASDNPFQSPSMYRLDFQGFVGANPDEPRAWRQPRLYVIPVANMETFPGGYGLNALGYYDGLLDFKPAAIEEPMPVLPYSLNFNNGEVYHGRLAYLDFQNGSGVRFLAEYSQAPFPLGNALAYIFQGLTSDGQYYVSLALPVEQTALDEYNGPYNSSLEAGEWEAFAANIESYMAGASAVLESAPDSGFTPDLARLDALVRSLNVRP